MFLSTPTAVPSLFLLLLVVLQLFLLQPRLEAVACGKHKVSMAVTAAGGEVCTGAFVRLSFDKSFTVQHSNSPLTTQKHLFLEKVQLSPMLLLYTTPFLRTLAQKLSIGQFGWLAH